LLDEDDWPKGENLIGPRLLSYSTHSINQYSFIKAWQNAGQQHET